MSEKKDVEITQCCQDLEMGQRCEKCSEEHRLSDCDHFKDVVDHLKHLAKIFSEIEKDYQHDPNVCRTFRTASNNLKRVRVEFAKFK